MIKGKIIQYIVQGEGNGTYQAILTDIGNIYERRMVMVAATSQRPEHTAWTVWTLKEFKLAK